MKSNRKQFPTQCYQQHRERRKENSRFSRSDLRISTRFVSRLYLPYTWSECLMSEIPFKKALIVGACIFAVFRMLGNTGGASKTKAMVEQSRRDERRRDAQSIVFFFWLWKFPHTRTFFLIPKISSFWLQNWKSGNFPQNFRKSPISGVRRRFFF